MTAKNLAELLDVVKRGDPAEILAATHGYLALEETEPDPSDSLWLDDTDAEIEF